MLSLNLKKKKKNATFWHNPKKKGGFQRIPKKQKDISSDWESLIFHTQTLLSWADSLSQGPASRHDLLGLSVHRNMCKICLSVHTGKKAQRSIKKQKPRCSLSNYVV